MRNPWMGLRRFESSEQCGYSEDGRPKFIHIPAPEAPGVAPIPKAPPVWQCPITHCRYWDADYPLAHSCSRARAYSYSCPDPLLGPGGGCEGYEPKKEVL